MKPGAVLIAWSLATTIMLVGCASTSSGDDGKTVTTTPAGKKSSADASKLLQDGAAKDVKRPPSKAVAREPGKSSAKRKPEAETAAKKPSAATMTPEAALAKAITEEKAYDQGMRQRFGVSTDIDLGALLSAEEAKEAARLHAVTEAARRRLGLVDRGPQTLPAEVKTLSIKGPNDAQPMDASGKATASLPTIPEAGATAPAKTPTALHLSDWFLDAKAHQAWREKQLAKLAEAKDQPTSAPVTK